MEKFHPMGFLEKFDKPEDIAADNLDGRTPRLPQVKILHAGACLLKLPDGNATKRIEAIILDHNAARAWWEVSFADGGGGKVPDCYSLDGYKPDERSAKLQAESCAECPHSKFGSDRRGGKGKDCREVARVHLIPNVSAVMPFRLTLPPSSLKMFDDFCSTITGMNRHYNSLRVLIEPIAAKNNDGIDYTQVRFTPIANSVETEEEYQKIKTLRAEMEFAMRGQEILADEMEPSGSPNAPRKEEDKKVPF